MVKKKEIENLIKAHNQTTQFLLEESGLVRTITLFALLPLFKELDDLEDKQEIRGRVNSIIERLNQVNSKVKLINNPGYFLNIFKNMLLSYKLEEYRPGGGKDEGKENS